MRALTWRASDRRHVDSYNGGVARLRSLILAAAALSVSYAQEQQKPKQPPPAKPPAQQDPVEVEPPEEDEALKPKEYTFNPLEAQRDLRTGEYYYKKGSYKAAVKRFEEATLYDPSLADAFLRLGETREKLHDKKGARVAFEKFVELKPDSKLVPSIKKKIGE